VTGFTSGFMRGFLLTPPEATGMAFREEIGMMQAHDIHGVMIFTREGGSGAGW